MIGVLVIVLIGLNRRRKEGGTLKLAQKLLLRESLHAVIGLMILSLLTLKVIRPWTALISASILLILLEYAIAAIGKLRSKKV